MKHLNRNNLNVDRRRFTQGMLACAGAMSLLGCSDSQPNKQVKNMPELKLSVSQWTLHKAQFGGTFSQYEQWQNWLKTAPEKVLQGDLRPIDFPKHMQDKYGFNAIDFVNTFFFAQLNDSAYWKDLKKRCEDNQIVANNMMLDQSGYLGHNESPIRKEAIDAHKRWLEACAVLGCDSVRINVHGIGDWDTQLNNSLQSAIVLADYAKSLGLVLLIENHGGLSSNADWLLSLLQQADHPNLQVMLDYDNFKWSETEIWQTEQVYDRYKGVEMLMPYANCISVKTYDFDAQGNETTIDVKRMVKLAQQHNFSGYHSVEYEGGEQAHLSIEQGIIKTKELLKRVW